MNLLWIKDKIEPQPRVVAKEIACLLKRKWRWQKEGSMAPFLPTLGTVWVFSSVSYRSLLKIQPVIASDSAGWFRQQPALSNNPVSVLLGRVVWKVDNAIHWINLYPEDNVIGSLVLNCWIILVIYLVDSQCCQ